MPICISDYCSAIIIVMILIIIMFFITIRVIAFLLFIAATVTLCRNLEQLFDGIIQVVLAILVRGGAGLPSNLDHLAPLAPPARRLIYLLETKIARLLVILLPPLVPLARRLVYLSETKIARLLDNLAQKIK